MDTPIISSSTPLPPASAPRIILPPNTSKTLLSPASELGADKSATPLGSKEQPAKETGGAGEVQGAAKQIEQFIQTVAQNLQFKIDDNSGQIVVRLIDNETQKVIRQIPSEEMLEIAKTLDKLKGLLISGKA